MVLAECLLNLMSFYDKNDKIGQKTTFVCLLICLRYCCPSAFSVCISVLICLYSFSFSLSGSLCYLSVLSSALLVLTPSFPAALLSKLLEVELIYLTAARSAVSSVCPSAPGSSCSPLLSPTVSVLQSLVEQNVFYFWFINTLLVNKLEKPSSTLELDEGMMHQLFCSFVDFAAVLLSVVEFLKDPVVVL